MPAAHKEKNMRRADTATCSICGKEYKACLSCRNQDAIKPWRNIADAVDCYKIFLVISQYNNGYLSKDDAKKQLEQVSFDKKSLRKSVQAKIDEILGTSSKRTGTASKANRNNHKE